jgi:hypothetical protein
MNVFGQRKDWVGQVLFLVSYPKGQVEKYVNVEAWIRQKCKQYILKWDAVG